MSKKAKMLSEKVSKMSDDVLQEQFKYEVVSNYFEGRLVFGWALILTSFVFIFIPPITIVLFCLGVYCAKSYKSLILKIMEKEMKKRSYKYHYRKSPFTGRVQYVDIIKKIY